MGTGEGNSPVPTIAASACAATMSFPLWKISARAQSGVLISSQNTSSFLKYAEAFKPPYTGFGAVLFGLTWARATIFYGSARGRDMMTQQGWDTTTATVVPPLVLSTIVQIVNMPIIRASIMLQDPASNVGTSTTSALRGLFQRGLLKNGCGMCALWHGTSAGILKTVPKYVTAVVVKDLMQHWVLSPDQPDDPKWMKLSRSAAKAIASGCAGAILTNPADVLRNEMFKRDTSLSETLGALNRKEGCDKNLVAVAVPIAVTIFLTDQFETFMLPQHRDVTAQCLPAKSLVCNNDLRGQASSPLES